MEKQTKKNVEHGTEIISFGLRGLGFSGVGVQGFRGSGFGGSMFEAGWLGLGV